MVFYIIAAAEKDNTSNEESGTIKYKSEEAVIAKIKTT